MRLLFVLAVWKRPEITEICFMGLQRLSKNVSCETLAVISEESMVPLCEKYGVEWHMFKNHPLGAKKNFGIEQALKKDFDYLVELGSDDLLKDEFLDLFTWDKPVFGLMDFALINTEDGRCKLTSTKIPKYGSGRAIERSALESCVLWDDSKMRGMDNNSSYHLMQKGFMPVGVRSENPVAISLRSKVNLWGYGCMPGKNYPIEDALNGLSEEEINAIQCLVTKNKSADLMSV